MSSVFGSYTVIQSYINSYIVLLMSWHGKFFFPSLAFFLLVGRLADRPHVVLTLAIKPHYGSITWWQYGQTWVLVFGQYELRSDIKPKTIKYSSKLKFGKGIRPQTWLTTPPSSNLGKMWGIDVASIWRAEGDIHIHQLGDVEFVNGVVEWISISTTMCNKVVDL